MRPSLFIQFMLLAAAAATSPWVSDGGPVAQGTLAALLVGSFTAGIAGIADSIYWSVKR